MHARTPSAASEEDRSIMADAKKEDNTRPPAGKNWVARTMRPHDSNNGQFDDGDDGYRGYYPAPAYYGPEAPGYYGSSQYSYPTTPPLSSSTPPPDRRGHYYYGPPEYHTNTGMPMPPLGHAPPHHDYRTEPDYARSREEANYVTPPQMYGNSHQNNREPPEPPAEKPLPQIPESHTEQNEDDVDTEGKEVPDHEVTDKDVLSGRGGGTNNHPGNRYFRKLVEENRGEYVVSKKWQKREIARTIVMTIRSRKGRFLKKENGRWYDIGDQKAREKTSQALREGLAQKMRQALRQSGSINSAFSSPKTVSEHVHRIPHSDHYHYPEQYPCPPYKRQRVSYETYDSHAC